MSLKFLVGHIYRQMCHPWAFMKKITLILIRLGLINILLIAFTTTVPTKKDLLAKVRTTTLPTSSPTYEAVWFSRTTYGKYQNPKPLCVSILSSCAAYATNTRSYLGTTTEGNMFEHIDREVNKWVEFRYQIT